MEQNTNKPARLSRAFIIISIGQALSLIGSSAVQFALIWWLAKESGSAIVMSLAGLAAFLPMLLIGPFAGVWVDRLKLKPVIIAADAFMGICAALFAMLLLMGKTSYELAYIVIFLRSVGSAFHMPAMQKAVPMLVPEEDLIRANGIAQMMQSGSFMLGPVLGAFLYAVLPLWMVMLTDTLGAVVACATVAAVHIPTPERKGLEAPHMWREMKEGARVLSSMRRVFVITLSATLCMVAYLPLSSLYPLMTSNHLGGNAWHAGIIEFVYAAGMMIASLYMSARGEVKNKFGMIHFSLFLMGLTTLLCGILPGSLKYFWMFAVLCFFMGGSGSLYNIPYMAYLQQRVPPEAMGRVFSLIMSLMSLAMPIGLLVAGPVAQSMGVAFMFLVSGIFSILVVVASMIVTGRMKDDEPIAGAEPETATRGE